MKVILLLCSDVSAVLAHYRLRDQRFCHDNSNVPLALSLGLVFHVVDSVSSTNTLLAFPVLALCVQKLLPECGVVGNGGALLDDNLLPVIGDLVDDPFGRLSKLEVVECRDTLRRDGNTAKKGELGEWYTRRE